MSTASRKQQRSTGYGCEFKGCRRIFRRVVGGHRYCYDHADEVQRDLDSERDAELRLFREGRI